MAILASGDIQGGALPPDATILERPTADPDGNLTMERVTPAVQGAVQKSIPVFLLVGPGTASGGEDFAFAMRKAKSAPATAI